MRRVIRRRSVGGVPPDWRASGAGLGLGASVLDPPLHAAEGDPTPGRRRCRCPWGTCGVEGCSRASFASDGVTGTALAIAPRPPASARARAPVTRCAGLPRATRCRSRVQRLTWAFPLRSWIIVGGGASRRCRGRLPWAGAREAQAPSPRARRAWGCPAVVSAPCGRRAPEAEAAGSSPRHCLRSRGGSHRVRSPRSATLVTASPCTA